MAKKIKFGANVSLQHGAHIVSAGLVAAPATIGTLLNELPPHNLQLVDYEHVVEMEMLHDGMHLPAGTGSPLSFDAPMVSAAGELIRYGTALPLPNNVWQLTDLLRGCFGAEQRMGAQHAGIKCVLIEEGSLLPIEASHVPIGEVLAVEALGLGDAEPVTASLQMSKNTLIPKTLVHGQVNYTVAGGLKLSWIRRPRVDFGWNDVVDAPIIEDSETYSVQIFAAGTRVAEHATTEPLLNISQAEIGFWFVPENTPLDIEVNQIGRHGRSASLHFSAQPAA